MLEDAGCSNTLVIGYIEAGIGCTNETISNGRPSNASMIMYPFLSSQA